MSKTAIVCALSAIIWSAICTGPVVMLEIKCYKVFETVTNLAVAAIDAAFTDAPVPAAVHVTL